MSEAVKYCRVRLPDGIWGAFQIPSARGALAEAIAFKRMAALPSSELQYLPDIDTFLVKDRYSMDIVVKLGVNYEVLRPPGFAKLVVAAYEKFKTQGVPHLDQVLDHFRLAPEYTTLHVLPSAPFEVVRAAYRALSALHHPDAGGDVEEMKRINVAFGRIEKALAGAGS